MGQISGTTSALLAVSFTDTNHGTAVAENGVILRTTDGGASWLAQTSGTTNNLNAVSFTDANNGTARRRRWNHRSNNKWRKHVG